MQILQQYNNYIRAKSNCINNKEDFYYKDLAKFNLLL